MEFAVPRPVQTFEGFVGQRRLVHYVERLVDDFHQLSKPHPPLLFLGPTGGETAALVESLAAALKTDVHSIFVSDSSIHINRGVCRSMPDVNGSPCK